MLYEEQRDLGDAVVAYKLDDFTRRAVGKICAFPACDKPGTWVIIGPALILKSLPDVCDEHLEYGRLLGMKR